MKSLKNLLTKKFPNGEAKKKTPLDDKTVFYIFKKVVKEEFGNLGVENFIPDYFAGKNLFVRCKSSNWASELWLNKNKIMKKINKELGDSAVENIKTK